MQKKTHDYDNVFKTMKSIQGTIWNIIKRSIYINIASIKAFFDRELLFMAVDKGNIYLNVKGIRIRVIKVSNKAFRKNVFCVEEEVLALFQDMSHVVIGAVASAANKNVFRAGEYGVTVNHVTESPESILAMDRLDQASV